MRFVLSSADKGTSSTVRFVYAEVRRRVVDEVLVLQTADLGSCVATTVTPFRKRNARKPNLCGLWNRGRPRHHDDHSLCGRVVLALLAGPWFDMLLSAVARRAAARPAALSRCGLSSSLAPPLVLAGSRCLSAAAKATRTIPRVSSAPRICQRARSTVSATMAAEVASASATAAAAAPEVASRAVGWWLIGTSGAVFGMVVVGGITRLTRSGLSMVDWRPQGRRMPSTEEEWQLEFDKYKQFPEYQRLYAGTDMSVEDFKNIYFWEWFHRMWGRSIGLVFGLPLAYFSMRGQIPRSLMPTLGGLFLLGGGQGLVGWWMVKSGLDPKMVEEIEGGIPRVSPYRLAAHLTCAFTIFSVLLYTGLGVLQPRAATAAKAWVGAPTLHARVLMLTGLVESRPSRAPSWQGCRRAWRSTLSRSWRGGWCPRATSASSPSTAISSSRCRRSSSTTESSPSPRSAPWQVSGRRCSACRCRGSCGWRQTCCCSRSRRRCRSGFSPSSTQFRSSSAPRIRPVRLRSSRWYSSRFTLAVCRTPASW